jgi:hypothetical protein
MALGQRASQRQEEIFVATRSIAQGPGHPFYSNLDEVLAAAGFGAGTVCRHRMAAGWDPPGIILRMVFAGSSRASMASAHSLEMPQPRPANLLDTA